MSKLTFPWVGMPCQADKSLNGANDILIKDVHDE